MENMVKSMVKREKSDPFATARHFDIQPQEIARALLQYGEQAGLTVMVHGDATGHSPGLHGTYATAEALDVLLAGSGLEYGIRGDAIIVTRVVREVTRSVAEAKRPPLSRGLDGLLTAILASGPVTAAEDAGSDTSGVVEEVIVSATYRDTRLMDTPITISAVTAEDIQVKGIEDIQTLYQSIPGLSYRTGTQTLNFLSVRGITPPADGGSAVGVYLDNIPMSDNNSGGKSQPLGPLFDMERVEVLKGPQGTLYGESNMGGSIRYITNKVNSNEFEMSAQAGMEAISESDDLSYRADVMINVPLVQDTLGLRAVIYKRDRAGVLDVVAPRNEKDVDTFNEDGYRVKLSWYATEDLEITGMYNRTEGEYSGPGIAFHCYTAKTVNQINSPV